MKKFTVPITLAALLMTGCVASKSAANLWSFPKSIQGVPVHHITWKEKLPYLYPQPWRIVAPKTFGLRPATAIRKAAEYWQIGWRLANLVYVQPVGLVGGRTGSPPSVYLVEFVGSNLGLNSAGPDMPKPPTLQFGVVSVNGHTGAAAMLTGGEVHGTVEGGRILRLSPEPATAMRVAAFLPRRYPQVLGLGGLSLAQANSVWQDASVAEYGEVWDPFYVYSIHQGKTSYIGTVLNYATAMNLIAAYDNQYACPKKIGKLYIVGIKGSTVSFKTSSGLTGAFSLATHQWSVN